MIMAGLMPHAVMIGSIKLCSKADDNCGRSRRLLRYAEHSKVATVRARLGSKRTQVKHFIKRLLVIVGTALSIGIAADTDAVAQSIENGVGVVCDLPQHVERLIGMGSDAQSAVEQINTQNNARVCEIVNVAFLVGGIVGEASNDKGTWQIRRILIVGLIVGKVTSPVQPYERYSAFIVSKASPI
jgi:hypothetical protein